MTLTLVSLVQFQLVNAYNCRSDRPTSFAHPLANRWLNMAIVWELGLLALVVHLPVLHEPFGTYAMPAGDWLIAAGLAVTVVPVLEFVKWLERRGWLGPAD